MKAFISASTTIELEDIGTVLLQRSSKARNLNITVKPFKGVRVAVPKGLSFQKAEQIVRGKSEWIKKHLERILQLEEEYNTIPKIEINRKEAMAVLVSRLEAIARQHGYEYNRVSIRNQKTRWGSCSSKNNISLNMKLTLLPNELRDYIILHELVHTKVKNHGQEFWKEMARVEPKAKILDKQMNQHSLRLL